MREQDEACKCSRSLHHKVSSYFVLLKIQESLMSIEIMYWNKPQKSLSQQLLFEVSLFMFHLFLLFIIMNIR